MEPISLTVLVKLASIPAKSSTAPSLQTYRSCSRPSSSSSSTLKPLLGIEVPETLVATADEVIK
jgi:hypothetical protein